MEYHDQDEIQKDHKRAQAQRLPRGAAVQFLETPHIFLMLQTMFNVHGMQSHPPSLAMPGENKNNPNIRRWRQRRRF